MSASRHLRLQTGGFTSGLAARCIVLANSASEQASTLRCIVGVALRGHPAMRLLDYSQFLPREVPLTVVDRLELAPCSIPAQAGVWSVVLSRFDCPVKNHVLNNASSKTAKSVEKTLCALSGSPLRSWRLNLPARF